MGNHDEIKKHGEKKENCNHCSNCTCKRTANGCQCDKCKIKHLEMENAILKKKCKKNKKLICKLIKEVETINNTLKYITIDENNVVNIGSPDVFCGLKVYGPMTNIPI